MPSTDPDTRRATQKRYYERHKEKFAADQRRRRGMPDYENVEPHIITQTQIAWFAGLYEGEGTCECWDKGKGNGSWGTALSISMTDQDVIEHLSVVTGVGAVDRLPGQKEGYKDIWRWKVTRREQVAALIRGMWPFLHSRRQAQLKPLLEHCEERLKHRLPTYKGYVNLQIEG